MNNKKLMLISLSLMFLLAIQIVLAALNMDLTIVLPKKTFYPNETIPINISVVNREVTFSARNLSLAIIIGSKTYTFKLDDLAASQSVIKSITLPEQAPGSYIVRAILNYTGYFGETTTLEVYDSFDVVFPEIERLPRGIYIKSFDVPDDIKTDKPYTISVVVANNGTISGDLIVKVESLDVSTSKEVRLEPGQTQTVTLSVKFYNPGVSLVEAKVYAVVGGIKYLLNYASKNVYVKEEKLAKLEFDKIELVDEPDKEINQVDEVTFQIYLKNTGSYSAFNVKGTLTSPHEKIEVLRFEFGYVAILAGESFGGSSIQSQEFYKIKTGGIEVGTYNLTLKVLYTDGVGDHTIELAIPLNTKATEGFCTSDTECKEDEKCENNVCSKIVCECGSISNHKCIGYECCEDKQCADDEKCQDNKCVKIPCECGEVINRQCKKFDCCSDLDCEEDYVCSPTTHKCELITVIKKDVLIVTIGNKLSKTTSYSDTIKKYREALHADGLSSFYIELDSPRVKKLFGVELINPNSWKSVKTVLDKIIYKTEPKFVLILGGVNIFPMPEIDNMCFEDLGLSTVPTDDLYGDIDKDKVPDIPVGRFPTGTEDSSTKEIEKYLSKAILLHENGIQFSNKLVVGDACGGYSCFIKPEVNHISEKFSGKTCDYTNSCLWSPPYCSGTGSPPIFPIPCGKKSELYANIESSNLQLFALHGDGTMFGSMRENGLIGDLVLNGGIIRNLNINRNPIIMTIACLGGSIDVQAVCLGPGACLYPTLNGKDSTAISFMSSGASSFFGNTRYGLGGFVSTRKFMNLYERLIPDSRVGNAFLQMKKDILSKTRGYECDLATLYQIQLYGDPTLKIGG
jgi:hypothetical protein